MCDLEVILRAVRGVRADEQTMRGIRLVGNAAVKEGLDPSSVAVPVAVRAHTLVCQGAIAS